MNLYQPRVPRARPRPHHGFDTETDLKIINFVKQNPVLYTYRVSLAIHHVKVETRKYLWNEFAATVGKSPEECEKRWEAMKYKYFRGSISSKCKSEYADEFKFFDGKLIRNSRRAIGYYSDSKTVTEKESPSTSQQHFILNEDIYKEPLKLTRSSRKYYKRKDINKEILRSSIVSKEENSVTCVLEPSYVKAIKKEELLSSVNENLSERTSVIPPINNNDDKLVLNVKKEPDPEIYGSEDLKDLKPPSFSNNYQDDDIGEEYSEIVVKQEPPFDEDSNYSRFVEPKITLPPANEYGFFVEVKHEPENATEAK